MGHSSYSTENRVYRATTRGYHTKSIDQIFTQRTINSTMSPYGIKMREALDSEEHPLSLPIVIGLDVTGSMGTVPHHLVKNGLPELVSGIIQAGIADPAILFTAIGDHECDSHPLQVGQFESGDEELDHWLTSTYLEGGGGGNRGESYLLAWYFAAYHTKTDQWDKRKKKGYLFTIGDEPTLLTVSGSTMKNLMGLDQTDSKYDSDKLLEAAMERYHVYHLHIMETYSGRRIEVQEEWKQMLGDNALMVQDKSQVHEIISKTIIDNEVVNTADEGFGADETEEIL